MPLKSSAISYPCSLNFSASATLRADEILALRRRNSATPPRLATGPKASSTAGPRLIVVISDSLAVSRANRASSVTASAAVPAALSSLLLGLFRRFTTPYTTRLKKQRPKRPMAASSSTGIEADSVLPTFITDMKVGCGEGARVGSGLGCGEGPSEGLGVGTSVGSGQTEIVSFEQFDGGVSAHSEALVAPQHEKGVGDGQVEQAPLSKSAG